MFYVYKIFGIDKYVSITHYTRLGLTKNIEKAGVFGSLANAKSWERAIKAKYPEAEMKRCTLKIVED